MAHGVVAWEPGRATRRDLGTENARQAETAEIAEIAEIALARRRLRPALVRPPPLVRLRPARALSESQLGRARLRRAPPLRLCPPAPPSSPPSETVRSLSLGAPTACCRPARTGSTRPVTHRPGSEAGGSRRYPYIPARQQPRPLGPRRRAEPADDARRLSASHAAVRLRASRRVGRRRRCARSCRRVVKLTGRLVVRFTRP